MLSLRDKLEIVALSGLLALILGGALCLVAYVIAILGGWIQ